MLYAAGIDARQRDFAAIIGKLLRTYPGSVTSWWRDEGRNKQVGGVANSLHLLGLAADIVPARGVPRDRLIRYARRLGLQVVDERNHIHVELDRP